MKRLPLSSDASVKSIFALILAVAITAGPASAQDTSNLRVGVLAAPPFVKSMGNGEYTGFTVDLWERLAADQGWKFHYVPYKNIASLLSAAHEGQIDLAATDLTITSERWKHVDFSHPYYNSGLQIMINEKRKHAFGHLWQELGNAGHLKIYLIGAGIILLFTIGLTILDRRWDPDFHKHWHLGLSESFFHVMSIVFTGKTTHKGLPDPYGKILAGIWTACGVAIVAYITSSITSVMTAEALRNSINGPGDLVNKVVGTVSNSTSQQYIESLKLDGQYFPDLPAAVEALVEQRINAIIYDAPALQDYDNSHPKLPITEVGQIFDKQEYGFAMPSGSRLRLPVNEGLLRLREAGFTNQLNKRYFGFTE